MQDFFTDIFLKVIPFILLLLFTGCSQVTSNNPANLKSLDPKEGKDYSNNTNNMLIKQFYVPSSKSNIYLIGCKKTREAALIDFGGYGTATIDKYLNSNGLKLKALLLTHGHNDHIWGASLIENIYKVPVYINQSDRNWFDSMTGIYKRAGLTHNAIPLNFVFVNDKDKINIGNIAIEVMHTPGHSKGSVCYYIPFERSLFTGDTLFKNAVGNINFAGGSKKELKDSVLRLLTLPEYTNIYAGHLDQTTIKQEKVNNMVYSF